MVEKRLMDLREYAEEHYLSERRVRQKCQADEIPGAYKLPNSRKWLIPVDGTEKSGLEAILHDQMKQHFSDLADRAERAAEGFYLCSIGRAHDPLNQLWEKISKMPPFLADCKLEICHPLEPFNWKKARVGELGLATLNSSLIVHLESESKGFSKKLEDWKEYSLWDERWKTGSDEAKLPYKHPEVEARLRNLTSEMIEVLNKAAARRTFRGKCDICKDW